MKRKLASKFKSRVALETLRGARTIVEIAGAYQVHPNQVMQWKKHLLDGASDLFATKVEKSNEFKSYSEELLLKRIGRLEVENDFLREASFAMRSQSGKSK